MQIVEVKNNLVKISYQTSTESLFLSAFAVIKDSAQSFIGQIIHLEASSEGNFAIVKLLFTFNSSGVISSYDGSIPEVNSIIEVVPTQELLDLLPVENPILIGNLAQQNTSLKLDKNLFEKNLLICSEFKEDNQILIKNFAKQLQKSRVIIFDLDGTLDLNSPKIIAGKNFKLPLNYNSINFIYEKGIDDAKAETKALLQEIFLEVQDYVKTLPDSFIPFESFKNVVDSQYKELDLIELVLLKNKLLKYYEAGVFAQNKEEFGSLEITLKTNDLTIFDLSLMDEAVQREIISYTYSTISELNEEVYVFLNVDNSNTDKKLLKQIFTTKNAYSSLTASYSFKYLKELKQLSKNLILFAPIQQQDDFAGYGVFLSKLNPHEFVIYGESSHHLPLIVRLEEQEFAQNIEATTYEGEFKPQIEDTVYEEIKRDVDEIYTAPKSGTQEIKEEDFSPSEPLEYPTEDDLTEDDLDFIENEVFASETKSYEQEENTQEPNIEDESIQEPLYNEPEIDETEDISDITEDNKKKEESFESFLTEERVEETSVQPSILPVQESTTPILPIYSADIEPQAQSDEISQGDSVVHPKYGKGTVEKLISYGSKTLCSINFDNVGRRLLDPTLAEIKKSE